ncbi:MAG: energy-coupling factor transporter transmembrane protein EcfT [Candidatus Aenigmarchaeota archaeon]|nr:energy-coupling factor transporter transmembrane protein EcfT [Candidatus Aenigmarchaeota archaeon]
MTAKAKLLALLAFTTAMLFFDNLAVFAVVASGLTAVIALKGHAKLFSSWLKPMVFMFAFIIAIQYVTYPLAPYSFGAVLWGVTISLRIYVIMAAVFFFVRTTSMSRIAEAFSFLPGRLPEAMTIAIAMLPQITELSGKIITSQKARGANFRSLSLTSTYMPVLVPLFGKTLQRSEKMALAMQARGYGD